jgi:hypothetical protein
VCDVRSPGEFEEDRVIGATSTPVLDNDERARVGTLYKEVRRSRLSSASCDHPLGLVLHVCLGQPRDARQSVVGTGTVDAVRT